MPTDAETSKIRKGMAADPDARAVSDEMLRKMRPVGHSMDLVTKKQVLFVCLPK
jgi:hypothetical protein